MKLSSNGNLQFSATAVATLLFGELVVSSLASPATEDSKYFLGRGLMLNSNTPRRVTLPFRPFPVHFRIERSADGSSFDIESVKFTSDEDWISEHNALDVYKDLYAHKLKSKYYQKSTLTAYTYARKGRLPSGTLDGWRDAIEEVVSEEVLNPRELDKPGHAVFDLGPKGFVALAAVYDQVADEKVGQADDITVENFYDDAGLKTGVNAQGEPLRDKFLKVVRVAGARIARAYVQEVDGKMYYLHAWEKQFSKGNMQHLTDMKSTGSLSFSSALEEGDVRKALQSELHLFPQTDDQFVDLTAQPGHESDSTFVGKVARGWAFDSLQMKGVPKSVLALANWDFFATLAGTQGTRKSDNGPVLLGQAEHLRNFLFGESSKGRNLVCELSEAAMDIVETFDGENEACKKQQNESHRACFEALDVKLKSLSEEVNSKCADRTGLYTSDLTDDKRKIRFWTLVVKKSVGDYDNKKKIRKDWTVAPGKDIAFYTTDLKNFNQFYTVELEPEELLEQYNVIDSAGATACLVQVESHNELSDTDRAPWVVKALRR